MAAVQKGSKGKSLTPVTHGTGGIDATGSGHGAGGFFHVVGPAQLHALIEKRLSLLVSSGDGPAVIAQRLRDQFDVWQVLLVRQVVIGGGTGQRRFPDRRASAPDAWFSNLRLPPFIRRAVYRRSDVHR